MAIPYLVSLDLNKNQIKNARIHNLASAPDSPGLGQLYYNTSDNNLLLWDGSGWVDLTATTILTEISDLQTDVASLQSDLAAEITRATGVEADLTTAITSEASRAQTAEDGLASSIQNANTAIAAEETRAEAAESALSSDISNVADDLSDEISRATTAEGVIAANLATEVTDRTNGDNTNATAISNEVSRATDAEEAITDSIGAANGIAPLNASSKIDSAYLPDSILGNVSYLGTYDASTAVVPEAAAPGNKGNYYIVSVAGTISTIEYNIGDWIISDGTDWTKVDNSDAVTTVFGRLGNVVAADGDYTAEQITFSPGMSGLAAVTSQAAIIEVKANIETEITRAEAAEASLDTAITNEVSRAETAEGLLSDAIDAIETSIDDLSAADISYSAGMGANISGTDVKAALDELGADTTSLQSQIDDLNGSDVAYSPGMSSITGMSSDVSNAIQTLDSNLASLNTEVDNLAAGDIDYVAGMGANITGMSSSVDDAIHALDSNLTSLNSEVDNLNGTDIAYTPGMASVTGMSSTVDGAIHALDAAITNNGSDLTNHISDTGNPHNVTLEQARTEGNTLSGNIDMGGNTVTNLATPSSGSDAATKSYVDGLLDTTLKAPSSLDASGNSNYPAAEAGDSYYITVAGKVGGASGIDVNVGDLLVASADNAGGTQASVGSSWFILESNRDQATETIKGVAEIATQAETNTGTDDTRIVTPLKLAGAFTTAGLTKKYSVAIGDGSATSFVVTHSIGSRDVQVQVYRSASPYETVFVNVERTSTTTCTIDFESYVPTSNEFKVVVIG